MKILFVEETLLHRKTPTDHLLEKKGYEVVAYLPAESCFGGPKSRDKEIPRFTDEADLVRILTEGNYDVAILNAEAFCNNGSGEPSFVEKYLNAINASDYHGRVILTTSVPKWRTQETLGIGDYERTTVLSKTFGFKQLDDALEGRLD